MSSRTIAQPVRATLLKSGYEADIYAWSLEQARLLREHRFDEIDLQNVAEEVESLGKSAKSELHNRLTTLVEHLLKLDVSQATGPRHGWRNTVRRSRARIAKLLDDSPSLRRELGRMVAEVQADTARVTADMLEDEGEPNAAALLRTQEAGFTDDELLGDWFPDAKRG